MINQLDARRSGNKRSTGLVGAHRRAVHFSQWGVEGKRGPDWFWERRLLENQLKRWERIFQAKTRVDRTIYGD